MKIQLLVAGSILGLIFNSNALAENKKEIIVKEGPNEELSLEIDGVDVPTSQLSLFFNRTIKGEVRKTAINVTFSGEQEISTLFSVKGILQSIGFIDISYFVSSANPPGRRVEIFMNPVPASSCGDSQLAR